MKEITLDYYVFLLRTARELLDSPTYRKDAIKAAQDFTLPKDERTLRLSTITRHSNIRVCIANDLMFVRLVLEREALQPRK